jgi:hypothetical protein
MARIVHVYHVDKEAYLKGIGQLKVTRRTKMFKMRLGGE